jgi:hypothetical protein
MLLCSHVAPHRNVVPRSGSIQKSGKNLGTTGKFLGGSQALPSSWRGYLSQAMLRPVFRFLSAQSNYKVVHV